MDEGVPAISSTQTKTLGDIIPSFASYESMVNSKSIGTSIARRNEGKVKRKGAGKERRSGSRRGKEGEASSSSWQVHVNYSITNCANFFFFFFFLTFLCKHKDEPTSTTAIFKVILKDIQGKIPVLQTIWVFPYCKLFGCGAGAPPQFWGWS